MTPLTATTTTSTTTTRTTTTTTSNKPTMTTTMCNRCLQSQLCLEKEHAEMSTVLQSWQRRLAEQDHLSLANLVSEQKEELEGMERLAKGERQQGLALRADLEQLCGVDESEMRRLASENAKLRALVEERRHRLRQLELEMDEEAIEIARLHNDIKRTGQDMRRMFHEDDESYIEIIIP